MRFGSFVFSISGDREYGRGVFTVEIDSRTLSESYRKSNYLNWYFKSAPYSSPVASR